MSWLATYLPLLLLTVTAEVLIALLLAPHGLHGRLARDCALANIFTHPLATLLHLDLEVPVLAVEILVTLVELFVYLRVTGVTPGRAALVAVAANFVTAVGAFLFLGPYLS